MTNSDCGKKCYKITEIDIAIHIILEIKWKILPFLKDKIKFLARALKLDCVVTIKKGFYELKWTV